MAFCHVLVLLSLVAVESVLLTGRALYCRDPDTGKLHAVNSTWTSSTFCGNYTCKLRRRNITETEYTPLRQLNITTVSNETSINLNDNRENITVTIEERTEPEIEEIIHKDSITEGSFNNDIVIDKNVKNDAQEKTVNISTEVTEMLAKNKEDGNRYLTENEIKSISNILQTVKKSDLDAIVDIYNLAQDIYNEMDKVTNEGVIDDTVNAITDEKFHKYPEKSYFYDPFTNKARSDMDYQGSNYAISTVQSTQKPPTYFNGVLTNQDFGKVPYYYPLSLFQRSSSYIHQPTVPTRIEKPKPCKMMPVKDKQIAAQNLIKPSYLLPYPFTYIQSYNYTDYPSNMYFNNNPYPWNFHNQQRRYQPYYNAYIAQVPTVPNAVLINPHLHDDVTDVEHKPVDEKDLLETLHVKTEDSLIPNWKTEELSSQILDEVRAHIDTSKFLKAFPFRNKLKLEKVGKLIKLDDLLRSKRSVDTEAVNEDAIKIQALTKETVEVTEDPSAEEKGKYETYLVRTTCQTKVVPGYFRYGNLTQPYPECCPQMINNR